MRLTVNLQIYMSTLNRRRTFSFFIIVLLWFAYCNHILRTTMPNLCDKIYGKSIRFERIRAEWMYRHIPLLLYETCSTSKTLLNFSLCRFQYSVCVDRSAHSRGNIVEYKYFGLNLSTFSSINDVWRNLPNMDREQERMLNKRTMIMVEGKKLFRWWRMKTKKRATQYTRILLFKRTWSNERLHLAFVLLCISVRVLLRRKPDLNKHSELGHWMLSILVSVSVNFMFRCGKFDHRRMKEMRIDCSRGSLTQCTITVDQR